MFTVKELIEILKKHDQNAVVALQHGFYTSLVKDVATLNINVDARYMDKLVVRRKPRGDIPIVFLTENGVIFAADADDQLYS